MSIRKLGLSRDREFVWHRDDALRRPVREDWDEGAEGDAAFLAAEAEWHAAFSDVHHFAPLDQVQRWLRPGDAPTIFHIGGLTIPQTAHVHHWRIDTPNGPTVAASCPCGADRIYSAAWIARSDPADFRSTWRNTGISPRRVDAVG